MDSNKTNQPQNAQQPEKRNMQDKACPKKMTSADFFVFSAENNGHQSIQQRRNYTGMGG